MDGSAREMSEKCPISEEIYTLIPFYVTVSNEKVIEKNRLLITRTSRVAWSKGKF